MKFKEKCPYCKEDNSGVEYNQFKPLSLHIRSHSEIPLDERQTYLERMKRKLFADTSSKSKLAKRIKAKARNKQRNLKLALHRKNVLSILKEINVEDFHIENVKRAGNIKTINEYLIKNLKPYQEKFKNKKIFNSKKKGVKKKYVPKSVRVIYTPMGNKR